MKKALASVPVMAVVLSAALISSPAKAQTTSSATGTAPKAPQSAPPAAAQNLNLANWWMNSSLFYSPLPQQWLKHFEGTVSYSNSQGNVEGSLLDVKGLFDLRKHRFTNRASAEHVRRDTAYGGGGGQVRTTQSTLSNRLDFDLTKNFVLVGGVESYHDTVTLIDHRDSLFGGFGAVKKVKEHNIINFTSGLAYSWFKFEESALLPAITASGETVDTISPSSGAVLFMQTWRSQLTKTVTLTQQGLFIDYFNKDLGRRWSAGLDLNVPIAKRIAIAIGYQIKWEINQYTRILSVRPQDRMLTTGIRIVL